jgi:hypothetical protein
MNDLETRIAVLEAKVEASDVAGLRREVVALASEMRSGFSRVSGALWAFAVVGGVVSLAAVVLGAFVALR